MAPLSTIIKAGRELGFRQFWHYGWYRVGLRSGYLKIVTQSALRKVISAGEQIHFQPLLKFPGQDELIEVLGNEGVSRLLSEADEIVAGKVRLFGALPTPLDFSNSEPLRSWTEYRIGNSTVSAVEPYIDDIKFTWEAARFGWAYTLARAYYLSGNERYPRTFWNYADEFLIHNPPYLGPNWISAQEVALRLIAFVFALQVFYYAEATTPDLRIRMIRSIAEHAARIPATMSYARAQNNNHLLCEAAGLITASIFLTNHPGANRWFSTGVRSFNSGLKSQIAQNGTYVQHSTNYHRLLLQIALWVHSLEINRSSESKNNSAPFITADNRFRLAEATRWLLTLIDFESGCTPNLGPNDGAYILPLSVCAFVDYRPVVQAAAQSFLNQLPFPGGLWDEMNLWLNPASSHNGSRHRKLKPGKPSAQPGESPPHVIHNTTNGSWAYLRIAHFTDRPGHADQLHLDLWWRGLNIAQDPGSYLYNAAPPWDNALSHTGVHNTLIVNNSDQMNRAGRFLYLDWAQSHLLDRDWGRENTWERLVAQHIGYNRLGVSHRRSVSALKNGDWMIDDQLLIIDERTAAVFSPFQICLHWLLPDWEWELKEIDWIVGEDPAQISRIPYTLRLLSPFGWICLQVESPVAPLDEKSGQDSQQASNPLKIQLVRAGKLLMGEGEISPIWGWSSPTYGVKNPALSLRVFQQCSLPARLISKWQLSDNIK